MLDTLIDRLARSRGIGDAYHDYRGELRYITRDSKTAILAAMGCAVTDVGAIEREIHALDSQRWRRLLPPVAVLRPGHMALIVALPADALDEPLEWRVAGPDGEKWNGRAQAGALHEVERRELDGGWITRRALVLPEALAPGEYSLWLGRATGASAECALIVAPGRCHEPPVLAEGHRLWGVAVQLYTLRSDVNWGIGDFADLRDVVRRCAAEGAAFVGLNPLHALFPSNPWHFSPYSPSTRHFLNVLYIAVPDVAGYAECVEARRLVSDAAFEPELVRLRAADNVDYPGVARAKLAVLRALYEHFRREHLAQDTAEARAFADYRRDRGEPLRRHALHDAIDAHQRPQDPERYWGWPQWPEDLRDPASKGVRDFEAQYAAEVDFHAWLQWTAEEQLAAAQRLALELGMPIGLYGDYAVGVNPSGSETWSDQRVYCMRAGVGAPPDALALKGQDWGIPPQDPQALIAERHRPFGALIAANMRHFGALRLDHVMSLFRQWWVPAGVGATAGGYVHYPIDDLMSVLALASVRNRCLVVGEDLGTVPDEMRRAMAEFAVYSYKVLLFEKHGDGRFRAPGEYMRRSIATVTTHDLPTLRGFWAGYDLALRDRLHLYPGEDIRRHVRDERVRDRTELLRALDAEGLDPAPGGEAEHGYGEALAHAIQLYLARSAAALVVLQFEDLIGMTDPVNVPGTRDEHANWQRKVSASIEDAFGRDATLRLFADVRRARAA